MPEHYKDLITHAPPPIVLGMMVGQVDLMFQEIPNLVKAVILVGMATMAYADIKSDIRLLQHEIADLSDDAAMFNSFMNTGDRCTLADCMLTNERVTQLERLHMINLYPTVKGEKR